MHCQQKIFEAGAAAGAPAMCCDAGIFACLRSFAAQSCASTASEAPVVGLDPLGSQGFLERPLNCLGTVAGKNLTRLLP